MRALFSRVGRKVFRFNNPLPSERARARHMKVWYCVTHLFSSSCGGVSLGARAVLVSWGFLDAVDFVVAIIYVWLSSSSNAWKLYAIGVIDQ